MTPTWPAMTMETMSMTTTVTTGQTHTDTLEIVMLLLPSRNRLEDEDLPLQAFGDKHYNLKFVRK